MRQALATIGLTTRRQGLLDITDQITDWVRQQGIADGLLTIFCRHTSASLVIQENAAPAVRRDMERYFNILAPESGSYEHDCQSASKKDPLSASKRDPLRRAA